MVEQQAFNPGQSGFDSQRPLQPGDWVDSEHEECSHIGGLGGWFGFDIRMPEGEAEERNDTWETYISAHKTPLSQAEAQFAIAAVAGRFETPENIPGGFWHQKSDDGYLVMPCGGIAGFSFRAWGDLAAAAANLLDGKHHTYVDYAWYSAKEDEKMT